MILHVNNVGVYYGNQKILDHVNLTINNHGMIAIIGDNGTGKTTLIKVIIGLIKPSEGSVLFDENSGLGYVPQITKFDKDFPITVEQVVLSGCLPKELKLFRFYTHKDKKYGKEIMQKLGIFDLRKRTLNTLSGGQFQKVLIARALVSRPNLLVLDEPTASIDDETTEEVFRLLKEVSKNIAVVIVSHDKKRVKAYTDRIYEMKDSKIQELV